MSSNAQTSDGLSPGRIIGRGFAAAHGALAGAVYLFLLHVPLQVVSAVQRNVQAGAFAPGREPDTEQAILSLVFAAISLPLGLAVFFAFPFLLGGMLGQVRDRIESPSQRPGSFGSYGRKWYGRLLGNQGLFTLAVMAAMVPLMSLAMGVAIQEVGAEPPAPGQIERRLLLHPVLLPAMLVAMLLISVVGAVYWVANCIVAIEGETIAAAWRRAFAFCRQNCLAVLALWLVNFTAGLAMSPLALLGQFGVVTDLWGLTALAVVHSALIGYWGLTLAGMTTSLYLDRRVPVASFAPAMPAAAGG